MVEVIDAATGALRKTLRPFGAFTGRIQVLLRDVNGDGVADLIVKARVNRKLRKKVYNAVDLSLLPSSLV